MKNVQGLVRYSALRGLTLYAYRMSNLCRYLYERKSGGNFKFSIYIRWQIGISPYRAILKSKM